MTTTQLAARGAALGEAQSTIYNFETTAFTRDALKAGALQMAFKLMPTALLTLTVKEPRLQRRNDDGHWLVPGVTLMRKASYLLHFVNTEVFGRKYQDHGNGLKGFGCIEKQSNHQPHLHLAITNRMPPKQFLAIKRAIFGKLHKTRLFEAAGTDFRLIGGEDADYWRVGAYIGKDGCLVTLKPGGVY